MEAREDDFGNEASGGIQLRRVTLYTASVQRGDGEDDLMTMLTSAVYVFIEQLGLLPYVRPDEKLELLARNNVRAHNLRTPDSYRNALMTK